MLLLAVAHAETSANKDNSVDVQQNGISIGRIFLGVCDVVSVIMLLFTLILYTLGPDIKRIHGKCIVAFCVTLSLYFVCGALEVFLYDLSAKHCFEFTHSSMAGRQNPCNFLWYFLFAILTPGLVLVATIFMAFDNVEAYEAERYIYVCYVNLFTVMAGNWVIYVLLNFVSLALTKWLPEHSAWSSVINYYARVLISLQGVAVFVACVWKTQYRAKLRCCGRIDLVF
ncbi:hypothetical protein B566_EDAN002133 [Ephemera danica]|nr:hypothetical protein B566_EDAN002133 [Ephemera danica]